MSSAHCPDLTVMAPIEAATAAAAVDSPRIFWPAPSILLPICLNCSPNARRLTWPIALSSLLKCFSWLSVSMISRCNFRYCSLFLSTFASSICFCAAFKAFSLSVVSLIFSFRSCCFCLQRSTFPGLNFSALLTFDSSFVVFLSSLSTCLMAFCSGVAFPLNSIVMPLISPAMFYPFSHASTSSFEASL